MRTLFIMLLASFFPILAPFQDPDEAVQIRVILVDKDLTQKPVPHFGLQVAYLTDMTATPILAKTGLDGAANLQLKRGKYRISSPEGIEFQGHKYTWELEIIVSGANQVIELSNDNAKITETAPAPPSRKTDELTSLFQKYQNSVVTVWSEIGHGTGFIVDARGLIVTNQHVVGPSEIISVQFDQKRKVSAKLLQFDAEKDIAVVWADISSFPEALAAPIARSGDGQGTVVEGERVFTIGSPLSRRKILTTGVVSKVEARAIISDININHGNSGGPLFNSIGQVVGVTTFKEEETSVAGIIRIEEVIPVVEQAIRKMGDNTIPSARLLPVDPEDAYPLDSLKESIQNEKFDRRPYVYSEGGFDIAIGTPVLRYWILEKGRIAAAKEKEKRTRKSQAAVRNTFEPLQDLRGWAEYAGEYKPVLMIQAQPQLRETFWSAFGRGLASTNGGYAGPARMKFVTDFYRMKLFCGDKEVEPIQPGKAATVENVHNYFVNVSDATYVGIYSYPADAVSPTCGQVRLQIFSEKDPNKATDKVLSDKTVERIWSDFQPYLRQH
jgi:S1-C subfamily serine protease